MMGWVHRGEWYTWFPSSSEEASEKHDDGRTRSETFPNQWKEVPLELVERLHVAFAAMETVIDEIDDWQPK